MYGDWADFGGSYLYPSAKIGTLIVWFYLCMAGMDEISYTIDTIYLNSIYGYTYN